ncbi:MAG: N-acetyl sugar amidotransferase [Myxococcales bacterium]|nr:N-acetyl sugar amidotransferase [Myxococcales bacterium]
MDTSDPGIRFDARGVCNRCDEYLNRRRAFLLPPPERKRALEGIVDEIRAAGRGHEYDCVVGVSGGADSTYTVYVLKELGIRPLAVHLDNGWNSALAVKNIERCLKRLNVDLITEVLDWEEFRDLQVAFLKASTPDSEIPTDHAILALPVHTAAKLGVRHLVNGMNLTTEGIAVPEWSFGHADWGYIKGIHDRFGKVPLRTYPHLTLYELAYYRYVVRQKAVQILDYVEFDKHLAEKVIGRELGWAPYESKHHESIYTRFFQCYILPKKFGFDKRRLHLATLVASDQMAREQAIEEMKRDIYPEELARAEKAFVVKKLGMTGKEFDAVMALPPKSFFDYPSNERSLPIRIRRAFKRWELGYLARGRTSGDPRSKA